MPRGKYRTARNVGFSSERLAPCIYRILAARAYFHGSSPCLWGTPDDVAVAHLVRRFIPTHVGNTLLALMSWKGRSVHPHACGEHDHRQARWLPVGGSSPRMWGTRRARSLRETSSRFIPTHVGNTDDSRQSPRLCTVHPHACGEHARSVRCTPRADGSSPRMWGTLSGHGTARNHRRFIPTHVGNTTGLGRGVAPFTVHPHACGEHEHMDGPAQARIGSSPRMWGTPRRQ